MIKIRREKHSEFLIDKMRICILSDEYLPRSMKNHARMLHELAITLVKMGHSVIVITPNDSSNFFRIHLESLDNVEVWNFATIVNRRDGRIRRAIYESLLSLSAILALRMGKTDKKFDICINYSPTIFFGVLSRWLQRHGAYNFLILRDFFPQWAIDVGLMSQGGVVARYFRLIESINYESSDTIAVQSKGNVDIFRSICSFKHPDIRVLHNWSLPDDGFVSNAYGLTLLREHGLENKIVLFYGGNIGFAQHSDFLLKIAVCLKCHPAAHILLVGRGDSHESFRRLKELKDLSNVTVLSPICQRDYESVLQTIHIGLFSLSPLHRAHNFPGKILGYMKFGKPILGIVNSGNDLLNVINDSGAGFVTVAGHEHEIVDLAIKLVYDKLLRRSMGSAAKRLGETKFSVTYAANMILNAHASRAMKTPRLVQHGQGV